MTPQAAVIPTNPDRHPLSAYMISNLISPLYFWLWYAEMASDEMAPLAAESVVVSVANAATLAYSAVDTKWDAPALNPYQPNHRRKVPRACNEAEYP